MSLGEFPCKTRANTAEFAQGFERTFTGKVKYFCPYCETSVAHTDKECWRCKKELTGVALKSKQF